MKYSTALIGTLAGILFPAVLAADVTLYRFGADGPPSPEETILQSAVSFSMTPVGVEKSGETAYVVAEAHNRAVYTSGFRTVTLIATPATATYTLRADATHYRVSVETVVDGDKAQREEECTRGSDGKMVCQAKVVMGTLTAAVTSTGVAKPWYTISNAENLQLPAASSAALPARFGAGVEAATVVKWMIPTMGLLTGTLLL